MLLFGAASQSYTYDDAWRLTGVTHNSTAETYGYDTRDRLTSGTTWGSYTYDANSNRLSWLGALGPMSYGIQPSSNRLASLNGTAVTTDAAGNLTSTPSLALTYDDWSRLRSATAGGVTTTYTVNGLGERVGKAQGATQRIYIYSAPGHLLGVYDGTTGLPLEEWTYLGERPVADARGGQVYAIETDHLMAPLRVLDATNATVWSWENREPFGASAPIEGTVAGQPFQMGLRFPGQYADAETGLVSNGFRDYLPDSGRYLQADPTGLAAGWNIYGYVGQSPLGGFDQFGLASSWIEREFPKGDPIRITGEALGAEAAYLVGVVTGDQGLKDIAIDGMRENVTGRDGGMAVASLAMMGRGGKGEGVSLEGRVFEVNGKLTDLEQIHRTTAGLDTVDGSRIIAAGGRDLNPLQRNSLLPDEIAAKCPGLHAEPTLLKYAEENGLQPSSMVASRKFCPTCSNLLEKSGATITSPNTAVWGNP